MNKLILGMALGACAGLLISEIPEVKKYLDKGKKKMQNIAKQRAVNGLSVQCCKSVCRFVSQPPIGRVAFGNGTKRN